MSILLLLCGVFYIILYEIRRVWKIYQNQRLFCLKNDIPVSVLKKPAFFILKRFTDIVVSLFVCLTILPVLYLILAPLIKLTSKGPVIFKQKRTGLFGQYFTCYKFRSMFLNDSDVIAEEDDPRITPIGKIIRKTHIDEFLQFINVLKGEMSLIGPRPSTKLSADKFIPYNRYKERYVLIPGITGLAQINSGRTLPTSQTLSFDLEYLEKMSYRTDIFILFETIKFKDVSY